MNQLHNEVYIPYNYNHAPVPGGGFVTGFCFHPKEKNLLYARTDIGGVYRYDFALRTWISLMDHVKATEKWESYPLSIALDPIHPEWIYIVAGDRRNNNYLCRSKDYGRHFEYFRVPAEIHGNELGRSTGERLIVDPHNSRILYFASQSEGLLISEDYGESFTKLFVKPEGGKAEHDLAFIWLDPRSMKNGRCQTIIVSASGEDNSPGNQIRGSSLYLSKDAGKTFVALPGQPQAGNYGTYPGFVGQRAAFSGKYLFVTMSVLEKPRYGWKGYSCDSGGSEHGCILRYELSEQGEIIDSTFVTPDLSFIEGENVEICEIAGFGGIDADRNQPGHLICSTQGSSKEEAVFYTTDFGEHWFPVLYDLEIGIMDFTEIPYMKPEYNGDHNLIHWLSDIKIDPFQSDRALFNSGTGIFMTENLMDTVKDAPVIWSTCCKGVEETVHLNVYSPPSGEVQLIDIIGDLGGFAFTDLTRPAENSFADENNNRYITCLNADYPDLDPSLVAVTARGNWKGKTTGGIIWSEDQCKTWTRLPEPLNLSQKINQLIEAIRKPNTNSGWVAISPDAKTLVWCVGDQYRVPSDAVVYTENLGKTWAKVAVFDRQHGEYMKSTGTLKVFADRMDPEVFYGFGEGSDMFISTDRARSFYQIDVPEDFPKLVLGAIDSFSRVEIRVQSGKQGVVWIALGKGGLWKITFQREKKAATFKKISKIGEEVYCQGMGKAAPGSEYDTLYVNGILDGVYGFYRSLDEGRSWQRINEENQMYGDILSMAGDPRIFGRYYIATGSRGVLWGEPETNSGCEAMKSIKC